MDPGDLHTNEATPPSTPGLASSMTPNLMVTPLSSIAASVQRRRSSTRSIKRKKFDDELVESSLTPSMPKFEKIRPRISPDGRPVLPAAPLTPTVSTTPPPPAPVTPVSTAAPVITPEPTTTVTTSTPIITPLSTPQPVATPTPVVTASAERKKSKSSSSKSRSKKTSKPPAAGSTKDLGRWKAADDLALITAVQQTCDLTAVYLGVKFTCKFSLKEIQERWYSLLYDPILSKLAITAIKQLHPDVVSAIQSKALFSKQEEGLLGKIASSSQPTADSFQEVLTKNLAVFHPARSAKSLHNHWLLMKQYHLLPDQSVQPMPKGDHVLNFSDAEDLINDDDLKESKDDTLDHELSVADRRQKREIRFLESELPKWQVLVDSVTGISPPDFDSQTLAVLRGRLVRYLMRSKEITLGRSTDGHSIDVDLSLEGPAWKISRRQGIIKLKNNADFFIANEGKRPIYIDGKPCMKGNKQKLNNNSVVEISCLRFIFLINQDLINAIRQESQKISS